MLKLNRLILTFSGHGETILKYCLAHSIVKLMENGLDANAATKKAVIGSYIDLKTILIYYNKIER